MKAIKIDPKNMQVKEIDLPEKEGEIDLSCLRKEIECNHFDVVRLPNGDVIFVDDEGLLVEKPAGFAISSYNQTLMGNGVVIGTGSMGESQPPVSSVQEIEELIVGWAFSAS